MTTKRNRAEDTSAEFDAFTATVDRHIDVVSDAVL